MFQWLARRREEKRRQIYRYWDGTRQRRIDPLRAYYALQEHSTFNADVHCRLVDAGDAEATRIVTGAVRDVFGVVEYDPEHGRGLTVGEQLGVLLDFYSYLEEQKKSPASSPTSPSSSEALTSTDSVTAITPPSSDSGSVDTAPTSAEQMPSG